MDVGHLGLGEPSGTEEEDAQLEATFALVQSRMRRPKGKGKGPSSPAPQNSQAPGSGGGFRGRCFNCNTNCGHRANRCPHPRREKGSGKGAGSGRAVQGLDEAQTPPAEAAATEQGGSDGWDFTTALNALTVEAPAPAVALTNRYAALAPETELNDPETGLLLGPWSLSRIVPEI